MLSGGEVKRVSVGVGMISKPSVLFLDEPTTGLDSTAAYSIAQYIASVAKSTNVAVIMTIHQPSALVFEMFDDLLLLEGGKVAFGGPIRAARDYFESIHLANPQDINPADYYLSLVMSSTSPPGADGSTGQAWNDLFCDSIHGKQFLLAVETSVQVGGSSQPAQSPHIMVRLAVMIEYFLKYFLVERGFFVYRLAALIPVALFAGSLYFNLHQTTDKIGNYVGSMIFSVFTLMLTCVSPTAIYAKDRREAVDRIANGFYTPGTFVAAQFLASALYSWFTTFVFTVVFYWMVNLNPHGECFVYSIFINWGIVMFMDAGLMAVIEGLKNDFLCTTAAMNLMGSNMLFSGFFRTVEKMPRAISWMCYAMPMKVMTAADLIV